jgi:hypothetical protein
MSHRLIRRMTSQIMRTRETPSAPDRPPVSWMSSAELRVLAAADHKHPFGL